ncbi:TK protein kinase, partial [Sphaeroforma arctica JP610]
NASAAQSELEENVQDIFSREYQMSDTSVDLISVKPGSVIVEFVTSMQEERLAEILGNEMVIAELISELGVLSFSMGGNETVVDVEVLPTPSPNNTPSTPKVPLGVVIAIVAGVSLFLLLVLVIVLVVLKNYWKKHHEPDTAKIIEKLKKQHMWTEAHDTNASETLRAFKQSQENKGWLPRTAFTLLERIGGGAYGDAQTSISLAEKLWFSWQICKGLRYIAQTGTVHRDVAARNVLLGEATEYTHGHPTIKISDMGLARLVEDGGNYTKTSQGGLLPYRWMAPESIEYCAYSEKSDVWSFAMTVWEIFNDGKTPYAFLNDFKQVREALNRGLRESRTESMPVELYLMLTRCWDAAPDNRPDFSELEVLLGNMFMDHQTISDRGRFAMSLENESLSHDMLTRSESQTSSMFATSKDDILKTKAEAIAQYTEFSNSSANGFQNSREPVYIHLAGQRSIDTLQGSIVNGPRPRASNPTNPTRHSQVVTPLALQHAPSFGSSLSMPNDYAELPTPVMRATFFADSIPDVSADSDATANKPTEAPPVRSKTIYDNVTNTEES